MGTGLPGVTPGSDGSFEHPRLVDARQVHAGGAGSGQNALGDESDELAPTHCDAARLRLRPYALDDVVERRALDVDDVHAHLHAAGARQIEPDRLHAWHSTPGFARDGRDLARDADVSRRELDVVRDEWRSRANEDSTPTRIDPTRTRVGSKLSRLYAPLQGREAAAPKVRGAPRVADCAVEEDRESELRPDAGGDLTRRVLGEFHLTRGQGNDWNDVDDAHPRMHALVDVQIDARDRRRDSCQERIDERRAIA
jgi:hypothetical protein